MVKGNSGDGVVLDCILLKGARAVLLFLVIGRVHFREIQCHLCEVSQLAVGYAIPCFKINLRLHRLSSSHLLTMPKETGRKQ